MIKWNKADWFWASLIGWPLKHLISSDYTTACGKYFIDVDSHINETALACKTCKRIWDKQTKSQLSFSL